MQKRCVKRVLLMALVTSLICGLSGCDYGKEVEFSGEEGSYVIDGQAILQALDQGEINIFVSQEATPEVAPADLPPVEWGQDDYYRIAQAFHKFAWQEPMDSWGLHQLLFRLDCEDASFGPQFTSFYLFKVVRIRNDDSRLERHIYVKPQQNQVSWIGAGYNPDSFHLEALDLAQVNIPAEEALRTAENNGGREIRLAVENKCHIIGSLTAGGKYRNWLVSYTGERSRQLLWVTIDEQTGEHEIIYSNSE
jgi:hypothetical protein